MRISFFLVYLLFACTMRIANYQVTHLSRPGNFIMGNFIFLEYTKEIVFIVFQNS